MIMTEPHHLVLLLIFCFLLALVGIGAGWWFFSKWEDEDREYEE